MSDYYWKNRENKLKVKRHRRRLFKDIPGWQEHRRAANQRYMDRNKELIRFAQRNKIKVRIARDVLKIAEEVAQLVIYGIPPTPSTPGTGKAFSVRKRRKVTISILTLISKSGYGSTLLTTHGLRNGFGMPTDHIRSAKEIRDTPAAHVAQGADISPQFTYTWKSKSARAASRRRKGTSMSITKTGMNSTADGKT